MLSFSGVWTITHKDKSGKVISIELLKNKVVYQGINYIFNSSFNGDTPISTWYIAPWSAAHTPADGNTYAVPGYTEATSGYQEANRVEWTVGNSTAQSLTNASVMTVTGAAGGVTIYGIGVVGGGTAASTKGNTAGGGTLVSSGLFSASKPLAEDETLDITYTLNGASAT